MTQKNLILFTFILAFFVILLGAFTRLTDAGLSCPDWPNCYGYITAPHTESQIQNATQQYPATPVNVKKAWTEMTHRYFAGTEGLLILILSLTTLFARKMRNLKSTFIAVSLLAMVVVQIVLGMLTVTKNLKPVIVLMHLLTGLSILGVLWWAFLDCYYRGKSLIANTSIKPFLWFALILVSLQIALGGWVSTHYAGLACVDFPYCNGELIPAMQWSQLDSDLVSIHMLHRFGALITGIYLAILSFVLLKRSSFRVSGMLILGLLITQITLGILNIVLLRPVHVAMTHEAVAILLLLAVITTLVKGHQHD